MLTYDFLCVINTISLNVNGLQMGLISQAVAMQAPEGAGLKFLSLRRALMATAVACFLKISGDRGAR